jgi:hypothetical protein
MQHRGMVSPHGVIFFCVASLLILGMFVLQARAQQTSDPLAGVDATFENTDAQADDAANRVLIPASDCRVDRAATVTVRNVSASGNPNEQPVRLVHGEGGIQITPESRQLVIERSGGENIDSLTGRQGEVVRSAGVVCGVSNQTGDNRGSTSEVDDHQYGVGDKKVTVIVETIPDKKILVDTGGPPVGALFLGLGLVGLGVLVLRSALAAARGRWR